MHAIQRSTSRFAIAALTTIAVLGGIAAELVNIKRTSNEGVVALWTARFADLKQSAEANSAKYKVEIAKQVALNAVTRRRAEADLKAAETEIEQANSAYARQQADAETRKTEAEVAKLQPTIRIQGILVQCYRRCDQRHKGRTSYRFGETDFFGCTVDCKQDTARQLITPH